jgi:hypothetical protein
VLYDHSCRTTPLWLGPVTKWEKGKGCVCWDAKGGGARDRIKQPGMWGGEREEELIREGERKVAHSVSPLCVKSKRFYGKARIVLCAGAQAGAGAYHLQICTHPRERAC